MQYIHVRNLEKFHPGYKDRTLQWAKIYLNMAGGDPEIELLDEIDWSRLIKLILLELRAQKAIPLDDNYLCSKGFNLKKRPIQLTIKMLHNFVVLVTEDSKLCYANMCNVDKEKDRREREDGYTVTTLTTDFINTLKQNPAYQHIPLDTELLKMDAWLAAHPGRKKTRRFILNWLNKVEMPLPAENIPESLRGFIK